jgi:chemotaxis family two-component system response regulator Rcp1
MDYREDEETMEVTSLCQILLAEDNPGDVGLVREAFRVHRVECDLQVIDNGEGVVSLIDLLDQNSTLRCPDLLLLDLGLPRRAGMDVLRYLRASERCGQTPVVVLSGSDAPSDFAEALKNAALHYFRKPASLAEFLLLGKLVKDLLSQHRAATNSEK